MREREIMQDIEPYYAWEGYYIANEDERSPLFGVEYNTQAYENDIYGYYIHPYWDYIGSETLYLKILYTNYEQGYTIIELFGEWNDTLHNDVMHLKRNIIDPLLLEGITRFILIGENVMNFHGAEDDYYAEWYDEVEAGWIVGLNLRDHVQAELRKYNVDGYINIGGTLDFANWRTMSPQIVFGTVQALISRRLPA